MTKIRAKTGQSPPPVTPGIHHRGKMAGNERKWEEKLKISAPPSSSKLPSKLHEVNPIWIP